MDSIAFKGLLRSMNADELAILGQLIEQVPSSANFDAIDWAAVVNAIRAHSTPHPRARYRSGKPVTNGDARSTSQGRLYGLTIVAPGLSDEERKVRFQSECAEVERMVVAGKTYAGAWAKIMRSDPAEHQTSTWPPGKSTTKRRTQRRRRLH